MKSYIILDRSSSMAARWDETISALQTYVDGLEPGTKVWLLAFDHVNVRVIDGLKTGDFNLKHEMQSKEIVPRAMTALYDAVGDMFHIVTETHKKKSQVVILTDGYENASRDVTQDQCKEIIAGWKAKGIDVTYLGADFDAMTSAAKIGIAQRDTINFSSAKSAEMGATLATRSAAYAAGNSVGYTDADRAKVK